MLSYWNDYPTIQNKLQIVCSLIEEQLQVRNKEMQETLTDFAKSGGKYLRPAYFLLFADLGDTSKQDQEQLLQIAASIEILHMATLIHDDIIDDSPLRRGNITVQSRYGKDIAVYAGDLLFTQFFDLLTKTMNGSQYLAINAASMKRLLLGELDQMHARFNKQETVDDYLRSINGKTAELFWLACVQGAHFGKTDEKTETLAGQIGRNIGIAFQVYDDILDYTADQYELQKPILEDLAQGVYTLPLIFAKKEHPEAFMKYLSKENELSLEEAQKVAELVVTYGGVQKAKEFAQDYTKKALEDIEKLAAGPAKKQITQLTKQLLQRTF
ncbi:MAG: polyprenyl synthetase family protein [Tetragenococcus halophilus]|uniref:polyprenyl synthetase family protein n=1 Tax=Tetragenococcus halophilus TaxID=51669 RepID=UPI001928919B|nr:polyprenyl synthetase family protein [Tetragenococcus halophilus]MCF1676760.1 polyprenyl synthetase family protein [Tetragenococcus halophilus]MCO8289388.1 polyprenyl synthetase family protein [Tetragenococcus halophilus]MDN5831679.1 polyprenyl synthetase family protein [Tetragenococcus halophilus]MDN6129204.1 polyprenyl synthetase family protein [Tetragenococcus halophilus]MDN6141773.1 polyprenyl synthetase family protein [Tetragenococcus halophilus]